MFFPTFFSMSKTLLISASLASVLASAEVKKLSVPDTFSFDEAPVMELGEPLSLWATNYHIPEFQDGSGDIPLRDRKGKELGPKLNLQEWCKSALEGSIRIVFKDNTARTYNFDVTNELWMVDCSPFYKFNVGKSKFKLAIGLYGDGVKNYSLRPYRTIATDPKVIPTGTLLYIPEARGSIIAVSPEETIVHDGYFFAADVGGAIKGNHIDVFIGTHDRSPFFPWITHTGTLPFKAYVVQDKKIIDQMLLLHAR